MFCLIETDENHTEAVLAFLEILPRFSLTSHVTGSLWGFQKSEKFKSNLSIQLICQRRKKRSDAVRLDLEEESARRWKERQLDAMFICIWNAFKQCCNMLAHKLQFQWTFCKISVTFRVVLTENFSDDPSQKCSLSSSVKFDWWRCSLSCHMSWIRFSSCKELYPFVELEEGYKFTALKHNKVHFLSLTFN